MATRAELDNYMRGSAGAVGLVMAPLLGAPPELHSTVAELGTAFQLTNFIRDVREDYELDRVYLPAEERAQHGVSVVDIAQRRTTDGLRRLLASEVMRARQMFRTTAIVDQVLHPTVRPGVHLARSIYERILDRVEALGFDVLGDPVRVPSWQLAGAALTTVSTPRGRGRDRRNRCGYR
jgi:phytoene synthase